MFVLFDDTWCVLTNVEHQVNGFGKKHQKGEKSGSLIFKTAV